MRQHQNIRSKRGSSVVPFVEDLLMKSLELPATMTLNVERANCALAPRPPAEAPPRSLVVKVSSYRIKEEILRKAWQKKGFEFQGKRAYLDHDYAQELLKKRKEYAEAKAVLKRKNIRFQTLFQARLRVFYEDGTVIYGLAEEATVDMAKRGLPVTVLEKPTSLLKRISQMTWQMVSKRGNRVSTSSKQGLWQGAAPGIPTQRHIISIVVMI